MKCEGDRLDVLMLYSHTNQNSISLSLLMAPSRLLAPQLNTQILMKNIKLILNFLKLLDVGRARSRRHTRTTTIRGCNAAYNKVVTGHGVNGWRVTITARSLTQILTINNFTTTINNFSSNYHSAEVTSYCSVGDKYSHSTMKYFCI